MYYLKSEEVQAVNIINLFGCIRRDQLIKLNVLKSLKNKSEEEVFKRFDKLAQNQTQCYFSIIGDTYISLKMQDIDKDILKAIDVMLHFDNLQWYRRTSYPFALSFSRIGNKGMLRMFDIVVLKPGEEAILSRTLEDVKVERLLVVLDPEIIDSYKEITSQGDIWYCFTNPVRTFKTLEAAKSGKWRGIVYDGKYQRRG